MASVDLLAWNPRARRCNPVVTSKEDFNVYPVENYVGTVLSPKSRLPVAIFANEGREAFRAFTPDRNYVYGAGYFDTSDNQHGCVRQHMQPGVIDGLDRGEGLGAALYVGGLMTVIAAVDDATGQFPWGLDAGECTYSHTGDRTTSADRLWESLHGHGLAHEEQGDTESEDVEDDISLAESDLDEAEVLRQFYENYPGADYSHMDVRGRVLVYGTIEGDEVTHDTMRWSTVKDSGLVLHLGDFFADPVHRAFIPPGVFASADWSHTPPGLFWEYARQNAEVADVLERLQGGGEDGGPDWLRAAICALPAGPERQMLVTMLGEDPATPRFAAGGLYAGNPRGCPKRFRKADRAWERRFGASYREPNPSQRAYRIFAPHGAAAPRPVYVAGDPHHPKGATWRYRGKLLHVLPDPSGGYWAFVGNKVAAIPSPGPDDALALAVFEVDMHVEIGRRAQQSADAASDVIIAKAAVERAIHLRILSRKPLSRSEIARDLELTAKSSTDSPERLHARRFRAKLTVTERLGLIDELLAVAMPHGVVPAFV